jgi:predicted CXXCH cytochrome family protein
VKYVGDKVCARCHTKIAESYRRHPMGRALAPVADAIAQERLDKAAGNPFDKLGLEFSVERQGDRLLHKATRRDAQGRALSELNAEVQFVLGSGTNGKSYLIGGDGYLFQSPISWFAQKKIWDLSPGFGNLYPRQRPVTADCLFCHCNRALPDEHALNHYRQPIFEGYAIGCERCHGPGELHVLRRSNSEEGAEADYTIVNPRRLETHLRDQVCEQCHLQGEDAVVRRGRGAFDYRPGLPLYLFLSVFVRTPELNEKHKAVNQVEQMYESRCYQASKGELGCISCHDPHRLPAAAETVAYYRERCLTCHQESGVGSQGSGVKGHSSGGEVKGCSMALEQRKSRQHDSCIACHMPRSGSSDIVHTAVTDHRILRKPETDGVSRQPPRLPPGEAPIVNFHERYLAADDKDSARDLGIALVRMSRAHPDDRGELCRLALPLLEAAVATWPEDVTAHENLAYALWSQGRTKEAFEAYQAVLRKVPQREQSLLDAATISEQLDQEDQAIDLWRRAATVNPWSALAHYRLARLLAQRQQWDEAIAEGSKAVRILPSVIEQRVLLIDCYLRAGRKEKARAEFTAIEILNPTELDVLRRWFAERNQ